MSAAKKQRYYVVWVGKQPGIYATWDDCRRQVEGVAGARYKGFDSRELAEQASRMPYESVVAQMPKGVGEQQRASSSVLMVDENGITTVRPGVDNPPIVDALAVDAACSGNPGTMEYQGIYIPTRTRVFHYKAPTGTNNIGEFLAIVHGLAYLKKHRMGQIIYSDSVNAMLWVKQRRCKSKLPLNERTAELWDVVHRAEAWLDTNSYTTEIRKWETQRWGEIPADFGRK